MANILGLALKVSGDASGLAKSLTPVDRALDNLGKQAEKATAVFQPFAEKTAAAGKAQEEFAAKFESLAQQLRNGVVAPNEYAAAFGQLTEEAKAAAAAFQEGLQITQQNQTADQARAASLERLNELLKMGAIDARNFGLESAKLSEGSDSTALDRFTEAIAPLRAAFEGGALSAERFAEQSREIAAAISGSTPTAERQATAILELRDRFEAGRISIEQYREEFSRIQSGDIATTFEVQVVGVREGVEASNELRASLAQLTDTQITAALQIAGVEELDDLRQQFAGVDGTQIDAVLKVLGVDSIDAARERLIALGALQIEPKLQAIGFENIDAAQSAIESLSDRSVTATLEFLGAGTISDAAERLAALDGTTVEAFLQATGFESIDAAQAKLGELKDVDVAATLQLLGVDTIDAARNRLVALGEVQIQPKLQAIGFDSIDAAQSAIESLSDRSVTATLEFLGTDSIDDARERLGVIDGTTVEAFLRASGFDSIDAAQAKLAELQSVDVAATLTVLGVDTIDEARQRLASISTVDIEPVLRLLGVDSIADARQQLAAVNGTEIDAQLRVLGVDGIESAKALLASVEGKNVDLIAKTLGLDSVLSLTQAIDASESKTVTFDVAGNADEETKRIAELVTEQDAYQAAIAEGLRVTREVRTAEERRAAELEKIESLLARGAISEETAGRARDKATGSVEAAARAEAESQKAREKLLQEGARLTEQFASEEEKRAKTIQQIDDLLKAGVISEETYAKARGQATGEADKAAEAASKYQQVIEDGLRVTASVATEEERRATELEKLESLLSQGAISQETFVRASERATGVEKERADAAASAARIIAANLTPQEKYDQQIQELTQHLDAGRLTQEQFNRAAQKAKSDLDGVGSEAAKTDKNIERLNKNVSILAQIEIGRLVFDGVRALGNAFTSVTSQITSLVGSVNSSLDTLNDFSARTGIGVEALQGYAVAAKLAGVDTEAFGTSIQRLAVNIGKATPGDALDKSLRNINLSVQELRALSPEQQFSAIGQAISQLPTAADRAAAAVEVFGKQGAALAPLFREGADSIEELRARAERLGIIVNETQIENVAAMNDGFDLVSKTVEGIIGQVVGNLAPAVTTVTDEFLRFVEGFAGAEGNGGTGIANAITDVLLQGADYLAGVFDSFVENFDGFVVGLKSSAEVFAAVGNAFTAAGESLRVIFNAFEIFVNGSLGLTGRLLEQFGKLFSTDVQEFGKGLAIQSEAAMQQNVAELQDAASNAAKAATQVIYGGESSAGAAGKGAATEFVDAFAARIQQERSPQFQIETNIEKTRERFDSFFGGIVDQSSVITDAMRGFEAAVADVQDPLKLNEEEIARIKAAQDKVNEAITKEQARRQEVADAAAKQADADAKRIESLTKPNDAQSKLAEDLAAVEREQVRVQEQQAAARAAQDTASADAATARLAQLDQLQAKLQDTQAASEQGFSDGFVKAFEATNKSIRDLVDKAEVKSLVGVPDAVGRAAAIAADNLQQSIDTLQEKVKAGILTKESYDQEVARQREVFADRLAGAQRVEEFLAAQLDERQRAEIQFQDTLEQRKIQAAENVKAIQDRITAEQEAVQNARNTGDLKAAKEGADRLKQLRQAEKIEKGIAAGRINFQQQAAGGNQQFGAAIAQQQRAAQSQQRMLDSANDAIAATARAGAELARRAELARPVQGPVATADIRTAEGAKLVLGLGAQAQDPQLIEARLQTKQLAGIRTAITNAVAGYLNTPAEIF